MNLISNKLTDTKGIPHKVKWSSLHNVCLQRPSENKIKVLHKYNLKTPFQVAVTENLKKPNARRSSSNDTNLDISKPYSGTLAVTPMLKKGLLQLCPSNAIPPQFRSFYESLLTGTVVGDDPDNFDSDCDSDDSNSDAESE